MFWAFPENLEYYFLLNEEKFLLFFVGFFPKVLKSCWESLKVIKMGSLSGFFVWWYKNLRYLLMLNPSLQENISVTI